MIVTTETMAEFLNGLVNPKFSPQARAEAVKEDALAELRALELQTKAGVLLEPEPAERPFFDVARSERDHGMDLPARDGPRSAVGRVTAGLVRDWFDRIGGPWRATGRRSPDDRLTRPGACPGPGSCASDARPRAQGDRNQSGRTSSGAGDRDGPMELRHRNGASSCPAMPRDLLKKLASPADAIVLNQGDPRGLNSVFDNLDNH